MVPQTTSLISATKRENKHQTVLDSDDRFETACKVAAGTSILRKSLQALLPGSVSTAVLLDVMGYDGFPSLAALEDQLKRKHIGLDSRLVLPALPSPSPYPSLFPGEFRSQPASFVRNSCSRRCGRRLVQQDWK